MPNFARLGGVVRRFSEGASGAEVSRRRYASPTTNAEGLRGRPIPTTDKVRVFHYPAPGKVVERVSGGLDVHDVRIVTAVESVGLRVADPTDDTPGDELELAPGAWYELVEDHGYQSTGAGFAEFVAAQHRRTGA